MKQLTTLQNIFYCCIVFIYTNNVFSQCFTKASAGYNHIAGKKTDGTLWVWGWGNWGQLGNTTGFDEYNPIILSNLTSWKTIKANSYNTFCIKNDGTLWGTGGNRFGALGIGNDTVQGYFELIQIGLATNWKDVVSSQSQTIAMKTDNTLWGWGQNDYYQVGNNMCCANVLYPVQISTATDWKMIAVSNVSSSFALKNNGTLWGWGDNIADLIGQSNISVLHVPTQINPDTDWKDISVGEYHILALKNNGTLWAWGGSANGEAGHNPANDYNPSAPNQLPGSNWSKITAGFRFSLGIKTDGTLWAWGKNDVGQLGDGTTTDTYIPVQIGTDTNWDTVSAGYQHVVALKTTGALYTWGGNDFGQLGNGNITAVPTPTNVVITGCTLANETFNSSSNHFNISPNPAQNELNLNYKGTDVINTIVIYDTNGKEVFTTQPVATPTLMATFSIAELQSGSYIVVLKNKDKTVVSNQLVKE